jgi:hypothetical protein
MKSSASFLTRSSKKRMALSSEPISFAIGAASGTTGVPGSDDEWAPVQAFDTKAMNMTAIDKPSLIFKLSIENTFWNNNDSKFYRNNMIQETIFMCCL